MDVILNILYNNDDNNNHYYYMNNNKTFFQVINERTLTKFHN